MILRQCRDEPELEELFSSIGRQRGEEWDASDRRLDEPPAKGIDEKLRGQGHGRRRLEAQAAAACEELSLGR